MDISVSLIFTHINGILFDKKNLFESTKTNTRDRKRMF